MERDRSRSPERHGNQVSTSDVDIHDKKARLARWAAKKTTAPPPPSSSSFSLKPNSLFHTTPAPPPTAPKPPPSTLSTNPSPPNHDDHDDDDIDPLDAFMAREIQPEMEAIRAEEARRLEEERQQFRELMKKGKLPKFLEEDDDETNGLGEPDSILRIPTTKIKRIIGPGGSKIQEIERKSKCRLQIMKTEEELTKGMAGAAAEAEARRLKEQVEALLKRRVAQNVGLDEEEEENGVDQVKKKDANHVPMTLLYIYGDHQKLDTAISMIHEALENKEQKERNRKRQYDKKKEDKRRLRDLYYLRHRWDYDMLELKPGASKAEIKVAYKRLAIKWHPDKHMGKDSYQEATQRFADMSKAFESLMSTDEETVVEQIGG